MNCQLEYCFSPLPAVWYFNLEAVNPTHQTPKNCDDSLLCSRWASALLTSLHEAKLNVNEWLWERVLWSLKCESFMDIFSDFQKDKIGELQTSTIWSTYAHRAQNINSEGLTGLTSHPGDTVWMDLHFSSVKFPRRWMTCILHPLTGLCSPLPICLEEEKKCIQISTSLMCLWLRWMQR